MKAKKLELFYQSYCPFCQIVLKAIKDLDLTQKVALKDTTDPQWAQFHYQKTNRNTVPCLYIDEKPMFESSDIVQWLKENKESIHGS